MVVANQVGKKWRYLWGEKESN